MSDFLSGFSGALEETSNSMETSNLDPKVLSSMQATGRRASALAQKATARLLSQAFINEEAQLAKAENGIEIPAPPADTEAPFVAPPEQLGHQEGGEKSQETSATVIPMEATKKPLISEEEARELLRKNDSLIGYYRSADVDPQKDYDFRKVPIMLIGNLLAYYRSKYRAPNADENHVKLFEFLSSIYDSRPESKAAWTPTTISGAHNVRLFYLTLL